MFLKFGHNDHIIDLFENGTVHINPIQYFREIEEDGFRGDSYEGVKSIANSLPGHFEIAGNKIDYLSIHLPLSHDKVYGNIYSLYCVSSYGFETPSDFFVDERVKSFGSHFLLIKQPGEFLKRIEYKLNQLKLNHRFGFVEYYNRFEVNGPIHLFQKQDKYEYQKEFRIYVNRKETLPLALSIGNLSDIAEIHSSDIVSTIELRK